MLQPCDTIAVEVQARQMCQMVPASSACRPSIGSGISLPENVCNRAAVVADGAGISVPWRAPAKLQPVRKSVKTESSPELRSGRRVNLIE